MNAATVEHLSRLGVAVSQGVEIEPGRPTDGKRFRLRLDCDVRVDEGAATDSRPLDDGHVSEGPEVYPAVLVFGPFHVPDPVRVGDARIVLHCPLPPALQDEDGAARFRQSTGENGAAEAAADHHRVTAS